MLDLQVVSFMWCFRLSDIDLLNMEMMVIVTGNTAETASVQADATVFVPYRHDPYQRDWNNRQGFAGLDCVYDGMSVVVIECPMRGERRIRDMFIAMCMHG